MQDWKHGFKPDSGADFPYTGAYELVRDGLEEDARIQIGEEETPYAHGSYMAPNGYYAPRMLTATFDLDSADTSLTSLSDRIDTLMAAHPRGAAGRLYRKIYEGGTTLWNRYIPVRVAGYLRGPMPGIPYGQRLSVLFRSWYPLWHEDTITGLTLPRSATLVNGANAITPGGIERVAPTWTINFTAITGTPVLTFTESLEGRAFSLSPTTTGTMILDMSGAEPVLTRSGTDILAELSGDPFTLASAAQTITRALTGTATITTCTLEYRRCYPL